MGKPRMQTSGTGRKKDASYHLKKKRLSPKRTTALVNRQGGFEGISILTTPQFLWRTRQTLWGGCADANPKTCCQTIHYCQKVVSLHYESERQYKYV